MEKEVRALRAVGFTLFAYTIMGWGWGFFLLNDLSVNNLPVPLLPALVIPLIGALPLLVFVLRFSRKMHELPGPRLFSNARIIWLYSAAWFVTLGGYALAKVLAPVFGRPALVVPIGTLALGLHFLFIALAFQTWRPLLTLAVFCLAALFVPIFVPSQLILGPLTTLSEGYSWMVVTSLIGMIWLWSFALFLLVTEGKKVRDIMQQRSKEPQAVGQATS